MEKLGGSSFIVLGRSVFYVKSGSLEEDRLTIERAIRTAESFERTVPSLHSESVGSPNGRTSN